MDLILLYHRIAGDGRRYSVSLAHFREQLDVLRHEADVVPLAHVNANEDVKSASGRSRVAITFDDGYRDNVTDAWPQLAARDLPATFFIVSRHVGSTREFWWDELEALLAQPRAARASATPEYWEVHDTLKTRDAATQRRMLDELAESLDVGAIAARPERLPLTQGQLQELADTGLAEIGAHTAHHVFLPACDRTQQDEEIRRSKRDLEAMIGGPVSSFSYPYGMYTRETLDLVAGAGFTRACKVGNAPVDGHNAFTLPRFTVLDWDAAQFAERLHWVCTRDWSAPGS